MTIPTVQPAPARSRSLGLKLLVVGALALLMTIPALFVQGVISDREERAKEAARQVGGILGGQQTVLGPVLLVSSAVSGGQPSIFFPVEGRAVAEIKTHERRRSLFRVPAYDAEINFEAKFSLPPPDSAEMKGLDWTRAQFVIGVTDPRGGTSEPTLTVNGVTIPFVPSKATQDTVGGLTNAAGGLTLLSVAAGPGVTSGATFIAKSVLQLTGAERLAIPAYAKSTTIELHGDWQHPSFDGGFLPSRRTITGSGFEAEWKVPFIARGVAATGGLSDLGTLKSGAAGVSFVNLAAPYQSVTRSVKYALLFLALIFLAYFSFEVSTGRRVHPAQYTLIGIAQVVFYLLLLSFSERLGFDAGFLFAAAATVALISWYAGLVFGGRKYTRRSAAVFTIVYGVIYLLLTLEDESLLLGSVTAFIAIATVMYMTRNVDWYSSMPVNMDTQQVPAAPLDPADS